MTFNKRYHRNLFSINPALRNPASKISHDNKPISYSYGNFDALLKWIENQNKSSLANHLGGGKTKYPLIWLTDDWQASEIINGLRFNNIRFYIACNSDVYKLSEHREPNFEILYKVANDWLEELRKYNVVIAENSVNYNERANLSVGNGENSKSQSIDIWDALIVEVDLIINTNCIKKLCSS